MSKEILLTACITFFITVCVIGNLSVSKEHDLPGTEEIALEDKFPTEWDEKFFRVTCLTHEGEVASDQYAHEHPYLTEEGFMQMFTVYEDMSIRRESMLVNGMKCKITYPANMAENLKYVRLEDQ